MGGDGNYGLGNGRYDGDEDGGGDRMHMVVISMTSVSMAAMSMQRVIMSMLATMVLMIVSVFVWLCRLGRSHIR